MRCCHNIRMLQNCLFHQPLLLFSQHPSVISSTRVLPSDYAMPCSTVSSVSACISKRTLSQLQNFREERAPQRTLRGSCGCHDNRDVTHPLTPRVLHNKADISSESKACLSVDAWMYTRHEKQALETCQYFHSRIIMMLETANYTEQSPSEANIRSIGQIIPRLLGNQKLDSRVHMRSSTVNTISWSTYIQSTATRVRHNLYPGEMQHI
jgi:hypothetical protein